MLSPMLVGLGLVVQLGTCAWVPGKEMQLAMLRARWSGVMHYGKWESTRESIDPLEFIDEDVPPENWQQACTPSEGIRRNTTMREPHIREIRRERPWLDPSCDAYSLGLGGTCKVTRTGRGSRWRKEGTTTATEADYGISIFQSNCGFLGPLNGTRVAPESNSETRARHRPSNYSRIAFMYYCPSTRPLALKVCPKCSSTSMSNWIMHIEQGAIIKRGAQIIDEFLATVDSDPERSAAKLALSRAVLEDFPGAFDVEKVKYINTAFHYGINVPRRFGGTKNITDMAVDISVNMPRSYCNLRCAWGDGRLRIVVGRNPYLRLMSYYKSQMKVDLKNESIGQSPRRFNGWSDFRSWVLALLSHRKRTGRFTSDNVVQQFTSSLDHCKQIDPACVNKPQDPCSIVCDFHNSYITWQDVYHVMPVVDSMFDAGYETHLRQGIQVMHVESIEEDIKHIEERLCREYDDCQPLPEYPHFYPWSSHVKLGSCHFDAKKVAFSNCTVTWEELWPPSLVDLVNLHYAEDFKLLGYKTTPFDVMPIRKEHQGRASKLF